MGGNGDRAGRVDAISRLAGLSPVAARCVIAVLALLLMAAALLPFPKSDEPANRSPVGAIDAAPERDADLAFYQDVAARIAGGERYYDFIVPMQRAEGYPVNPGFAVRLPTLAYLSAILGAGGLLAAALALTLATAAAWWARLGAELADPSRRRIAFAFLAIGASLGLNRHFFPLHEFWAGMLLALAFALHRPDRGRWGAALLVAALALAIRELALPFVALMAAMAGWRREWREAAAWIGLALLFAGALAAHFHVLSAAIDPSDPRSPSWLVFDGLSGFVSKIVLTTNLRLLPQWLAGPLVIVSLLGWASWRGRVGTQGALLLGGYAIAFMIAGRADNYYWGALMGPIVLVGLAFAPDALKALKAAALPVPPGRSPALS